MLEKLYTIREAARILQADRATLRRCDREGKIKRIRLQNNYGRIPESELNHVLGIH